MSWLSELGQLSIGFITINSRMAKVEKKAAEIEKNYLSRFDDVKDRIATSETLIIDRINNIHIDIIDRINKEK